MDSHFLDFDEIKLRSDERPDDLYQMVLTFIDDNLLRQGGGITHHRLDIEDDEEMTSPIENFVVLTWLRLVHPELPRLVKQRYGTELRSRTLVSIKPEILHALLSLLEEIRTSEDAKAFRSFAFPSSPDRPRNANISGRLAERRLDLKCAREQDRLVRCVGKLFRPITTSFASADTYQKVTVNTWLKHAI
jgi:hypothetical protein